jgi:hypothetical protein
MRNHEELIDLIEKYARTVGIDRPFPPEADGRIWAGRYAQIALCMVKKCTIDAIMAAKESWQQKLDESLVRQEQANLTVIDGYLLLALPAPPDDRLRAQIRGVEMDTFICRKHLVWPENGELPEERWRRLFNVTVLGLPPSPPLSFGPNMPLLSGSQRIAWGLIMEMGPELAAAKILSEGSQ